MRSKVFTAEGPIATQKLGWTQAHEHFLIDLTWLTMPSPEAAEQHYYEQPIASDNYEWVHYHSIYNRQNAILTDEHLALEDYAPLTRLGVEAVIDCTPRGVGFNPALVRKMCRQLGLKVVHGTGYYTEGSIIVSKVPESAEAVADELLRDLTVGMPEADFKAGFIGEIGTSWPFQGFETHVLKGACRAQKQTGSCLYIHPGYSPQALVFVADFVEREGVDPNRVVLCHCDSRLQEDLATQKVLAERGFYIAYDTFGRQRPGPLVQRPHPSDAQRIERLRHLADTGYLERIHISTDVCFRTELAHYGGYGRQHLFQTVVPQMRNAGFTESQMHTILVENPARAMARPGY